MLTDLELPESLTYKTGSEHEPMAFFLDAFSESNEVDLLMGYYSSTAINVLALGFAKFIAQGGRVRIVINQVVSEKDKTLLTEYPKLISAHQIEGIYTNISILQRDLSDKGVHFYACLAYLLKERRVEIRAIRPRSGRGISHYKSGVFRDGDNEVLFSGSCNFTATGLLENLEALEVSISWESRQAKFTEFSTYFERIFNGESKEAELLPAEELEVAIIDKFGGRTLDDLLRSEELLMKGEIRSVISQKFKATIERAQKKIEQFKSAPRFPYPSGPRAYQIEAQRNWVANGYTGIFAMATGTGKTLTALNCILEHYKEYGEYRALILVPYKVLVDQWEKEAKAFNFKNVLKVSSAYPAWKAGMDRLIENDSHGVAWSRIIICTYKTFGGDEFQSRLAKLDGSRMILIADEAHNLGAGNVTRVLPKLVITKRIGLSATPKRVYDEEGSEAIERFFKDEEPFTYSFSMERAIDEGILCQYAYYPRIIQLTEEEMLEYRQLSEEMVKLFMMLNAKPELKSRFEMLVLKRKRIIHKAQNKISAFKEIIEELGDEDHLKYTLVYAPEGSYDEGAEVLEAFPKLEGDTAVINQYSHVIREVAPATTVDQYTSTSEGREHILSSFMTGKIDVLLSMKCLDEGVDIPRTERAIFCSSTANPRQFIQRRGRILRQHPDKHFATIYDLVVVPWVSASSPSFAIEQKLVRSELIRVVQFAFMARNSDVARDILAPVCQHYNLSLDLIHQELTATA